MYDYIVVGAGYAGAVCARRLAEELDARVLVLDKRGHIAGNMYDFYNADGILVHQYGPHISVMNEKRTFDFLSRFTEWIPYHHSVNVEIDGKQVPLPVNLTSIELLFHTKEAISLKHKLVTAYGAGSGIPILELLKSEDAQLKKLAEYIYEKVFVHYTMKMWGLSPDEIDPSVTARIPVRLSYDNRHFLHTYQVMPKYGFTRLFEKMLGHPKITVRLNTNASEVLRLLENGSVEFQGQAYDGRVIYTGALDELFGYRYGALPYRSLAFEFQTFAVDYVQESTVLNWPDDRPATRRTEMKRLTGQKKHGVTTTVTEYPGRYDPSSDRFCEPYYPIVQERYTAQHGKYLKELGKYKQIQPVGRLADYKYYNMEAVIQRALDVSESLIGHVSFQRGFQ